MPPILYVHFDPSQQYSTNYVVETIIRQARLKHITTPVIIEVSGIKLPDELTDEVHSHFYHLAVSSDEEYILTKRRAVRSTVKGLAFLLTCLGISYLANLVGGPGGRFVHEGATIAGWVGMWKPMEILLYGLAEQHKKLRRYKFLAQSKVVVK